MGGTWGNGGSWPVGDRSALSGVLAMEISVALGFTLPSGYAPVRGSGGWPRGTAPAGGPEEAGRAGGGGLGLGAGGAAPPAGWGLWRRGTRGGSCLGREEPSSMCGHR